MVLCGNIASSLSTTFFNALGIIRNQEMHNLPFLMHLDVPWKLECNQFEYCLVFAKCKYNGMLFLKFCSPRLILAMTTHPVFQITQTGSNLINTNPAEYVL